jgi:GNAT superfamily N-acetyltransferase
MKSPQTIIDHWHIGAIKRQQDCDGYILVNTNQGDFALVMSEDVSKLNQARTDLLSAGWRTKTLTKPRLAHVDGRHYQLWRLESIPKEQQVKIRPARDADYTAVERLTRRLHNLDYRGVPGFLKKDPRVVLSRAAFIGVLESKTETYFLAEGLGRVVGLIWIGLSVQDDQVMARLREAEIGVLYVEPAWRRQGIATALLIRAEKWARAKRADRLVVVTYPYAKSATALYEKFGLITRSIKLNRLLK